MQQLSYFNYVNSEEKLLQYSFGIGIIKYIINNDNDYSPILMIVHGAWNVFLTELMSNLVPKKMRIFIPIIDISCFSYNMYKNYKKLKSLNNEPSAPPKYL